MTTVASVWTNAQFLDGAAIKGPALSLRIAAGNVPNFVDLQTGGWGEHNSGPAQQRPDADDGEFRHAGRCARGMRHAGDADACDKLFQAAKPPKGDAPNDTLTAAEPIARAPWYLPEQAVCPARISSIRFRRARTCAPVPFMPYLNTAPSAWVLPLKIRRRRLSRGRQGDVRQRGQPLGRRQFHHRLAGVGRAVAGSCHQVRPERPPAVADHHGLHWRRDGGRHLRRGGRRQRQRLAHQLRQQVDHRIRQERQAADAARRHHFRWQTRADAGRHRHAERRRVGSGRREEPARLLSQGRSGQGPDCLRGRQRGAVQVVSGRRSISASTSRTGFG